MGKHRLEDQQAADAASAAVMDALKRRGYDKPVRDLMSAEERRQVDQAIARHNARP
jgi:hypothetical protein